MPRGWWRGVPLAVLLLSGGAHAADPFFKEPLKLDLSAPFTGPDGVPATPASALLLSADEIASIQAGKHKAALLWHGGGDWVGAVNKGASDRFKELGVAVVATADAQYDPAKQANDIETALALQPSAILTLLLDPVQGAAALGPAVEKGVKVVLPQQPGQGLLGREGVCRHRHGRYPRHGRGGRRDDGGGARREGRYRLHLPRRELLHHQRARQHVPGDHRTAFPGHHDRRRQGLYGGAADAGARGRDDPAASRHQRHLRGLGCRR